MVNTKYLILGAGPSGLTFAHQLLQLGVPLNQITVLEKNTEVGGLCRSETVDESPLDIGGGHFLDTKRPRVLDFLFQFMPKEEWTLFNRVSKIKIRNVEIDHPLEANLWQFPLELQVEYLESIAQAGCIQKIEEPLTFAKWIQWKFGSKISQDYLLPYNRKIWSIDPDELGTYWLYKLPNVSFKETLASCLTHKSMGALPAHGTFYYPKAFGYGEVWKRMGNALGGSIVKNTPVESIDLQNLIVNGHWKAEKIISTIPWTQWKNFCTMPENIEAEISQLKNASIDIDYFPEELANDSHWIYEPNESIAYHRILVRSNFCHNSKGYWTETNSKRSPSSVAHRRFHNEFAYPINTVNKPNSIKIILDWAASNSIFGIGRWGKWEHMNSDVAVLEALESADSIYNNSQ